MKFKIIHPKWGELPHVFEPKTRKKAEEIMLLHRNMGDDILILEDDPPETEEVSADS